MPSILILVPLLGLILLNLPLKETKKAAFWFGLMIALYQVGVTLAAGRFGYFEDVSINPLEAFGIRLEALDPLSQVMLLAIGIVAFAALFVAKSTITDEDKLFNFSNLILVLFAGMNGVVMVSDLFSLYVFLEITAVCSFILIALERGKNALEGAFKYIVMSAVATIMMLTAIMLLYITCGSTMFSIVRQNFTIPGNAPMVTLAMVIFTAGLFIKGGLVPFHGWLPDAYSSAPSAVSVMLAGIVTKTTGIYTLMRLGASVFTFTPALSQTLMFIGTVSILVGAFAALGQKDFKRMLAYSSISQVGYIVLAFGTGTMLGFAAAIFHLFNHSVFKSQLFVNSAAVEQETGTTNMDEMGGLSQKMPYTGFTSVVAFLSTAGIPPLSGFWSKVFIILALWNSGNYTYAVIAVLASILTLAYFLSMQRRVFFGKLKEGFENLKEGHFGVVFPAVVLAAVTIAVGLLFPFFIMNSIILPISSIF